MNRQAFGRPIDFVGGLVVGCVAGYVLGWFCSVLPPRVRILWLLAAATGVACGWIASAAAPNLGFRSRLAVVVFSLAAAATTVYQYVERSVAQFAAADAQDEPESAVAKMFLAQAGDEVGGIPVSPRARWLRWRVKALGIVESPWPAVVGWSETAVCVIAACLSGVFFSSGAQRPKTDALGAVADSQDERLASSES